MVALHISKRGAITLPPQLRKKLGFDRASNALVLVEEKDGGLFLQAAVPVPLRNFSQAQLKDWVRQDEVQMKKLKKKKV